MKYGFSEKAYVNGCAEWFNNAIDEIRVNIHDNGFHFLGDDWDGITWASPIVVLCEEAGFKVEIDGDGYWVAKRGVFV